MSLPQRKNLRLPNWDYAQPNIYFVTLCIKNREPLLSNVVAVGDDAHIVPKPYGKIVEKYITSIPQVKKYVIMPDHIHLLVHLQEKDKNLSAIVRSLKTLTTKEIGTSVFQRSFYDHIVRNEKDYQAIWEYIQNNPKSRMVKQNALACK